MRYERAKHTQRTAVLSCPCANELNCNSVTARTMMPGAAKEGWGSLDLLMNQCQDLRDVLKVVAPSNQCQYIPYFDNSFTHNKREDKALIATNMLVKWGKQAGVHDSVIGADDGWIGEHPAVMWCLPGKGTGE